MQTARYISSGGMPAGTGGATATTAAGEVVGAVVPAGLPVASGLVVVARPAPGAAAVTTAGAGGAAASAAISSMARSIGIRTLLLVAGLTHPYDESSVFPWFRSSSVFLASLTWSADRGAGGGVRFANVIVKK